MTDIPPSSRTHRGHSHPARGAELLQPPREVRACPGGFYRLGSAGTGTDRSLAAGSRAPSRHRANTRRERRTARSLGGRSGGPALLTAPSATGRGWAGPCGRRGSERGAGLGARSGARPYRGTGGKAAPRGGSARARQQRALRRARARRSGEAPRCSMAATCGGKSAAVTLRPGPPAPAGAPGLRLGPPSDYPGSATNPGPRPQRRRRAAAGSRWRRSCWRSGKAGIPEGHPGPVRGAAVPGAQRLKRVREGPVPAALGFQNLSPLPDGRDVFPAGPGGEKRSEGTGRAHPSSSAWKLPLWRGESYSRSRESVGGSGWAGAERSGAGAVRPAPLRGCRGGSRG